MEIKHRINNTVFKERLRLTDAGATAILADAAQLGELPAHLADGEAERRASTVASVLRASREAGFGAVEVITYLREAWVGTVDPRLRLTFDMHGRALRPHRFSAVADDAQGHPIIDRRLMVMEVKFDRAVPRWIRDILVERGLALQRFSKYAAGVEALGLVPVS